MHTELVSYANPSQFVRNEVLEDVNDHHRVVFVEMKAPLGHNRSFLNALVFKKLSDSPPSYVWVAAPRTSHKGIIKQAHDRHTIRGEFFRCVRLTALASGVTRLEYASKLDMKSRIPRWLAEKHVIPAMMRLPLAIQLHFLQMRPPGGCDAVDGAFVGALLVEAVQHARRKRQDLALACVKFAHKTDLVQGCEFEHIADMLAGMLDRKYHRPRPVADDEPAKLNKLQARTIGRSIRSLLLLHTAPSEALDDVLRTYPALRKMDEGHVWFRPMMESIVAPLLVTSFGSRVRLVLITILGLLDTVSNVATVAMYHFAGRHSAGASVLCLIMLSNVLKIYVMFLRNKGRANMAIEALLVVMALRPVVDLYKKMRGRDEAEEASAVITKSTEQACVLAIDAILVSVPTSIIKLADLVCSGSWSVLPCLSIVISWLVVAANMTSLSFMLDLESSRRELVPYFYGYVPLGKWRGRAT